MENKTVKELKQIAKERKIKGYYKFKKEDLVRALQPQRSILSWFRSKASDERRRPVITPRPVPAPRPIPAPRSVIAPRSIAQSPIIQRPIPAPRPVSNDLISFGPSRLQNRATRDETSIIDEPFQDTTNVITPRPGLFSRFKTNVLMQLIMVLTECLRSLIHTFQHL